MWIAMLKRMVILTFGKDINKLWVMLKIDIAWIF
jgi:hypothetical protein